MTPLNTIPVPLSADDDTVQALGRSQKNLLPIVVAVALGVVVFFAIRHFV